MAGIENISNLPNYNKNIKKQNQADSEKTKENQQVNSDKSSAESAKSSANKKANSAQDKVEISRQARQAGTTRDQGQVTVEKYAQELKSLKTASKGKLKEVHKNIKSGKYSNSKVLNEIVNSMVEQGGMDTVESANQVTQSQNAESSDTISEERVQEIQQNIDNGKYESEDVLDTIVDSMTNPQLF